MTRRRVWGTLVFVGLLACTFWLTRPTSPSPQSGPSTCADTTTPTTRVSLALLRDPQGPPDRGCDDIVFVDVPACSTTSRLSAALKTLFALDRDSVGGARHFMSRTNETLTFDHATVAGDTAHVYLTGRLTGLRGVCDNPRARIQIEETARHVAGVDHVVLYRNNRRTNLQPDGRGPDS